MKEATGELNMTVITVVAIAAIAALFTIFIMPQIQANIALQTACSNMDADGNYEAEIAGGTEGAQVQHLVVTSNVLQHIMDVHILRLVLVLKVAELILSSNRILMG